jgi:hypothetical protein
MTGSHLDNFIRGKILQPGKLGYIGLGNITILAKTAAKVATNTADGKDNVPGMEMIKRLFLNGIIMESRQFPVNLRNQAGIHIPSYPALSCFSPGEGTQMGTKEALHLTFTNFPKKQGFSHGFVQVNDSLGIGEPGGNQK